MKKLLFVLLFSQGLFAKDLLIEFKSLDETFYLAKNYDELSDLCRKWDEFESRIWGFKVTSIQTNRPKIDEVINQKVGSAESWQKQLEADNAEKIKGLKEELNKKSDPVVYGTYCSDKTEINTHYLGHYRNIDQIVVESEFYQPIKGRASLSWEYFLFDENDKRLKLDDIIKADKKSALQDLLFQDYLNFLKDSEFARDINEDEKKEILSNILNENFYFALKGLQFNYPAESLMIDIAGELYLEVPYEKLKDILLEQYQ